VSSKSDSSKAALASKLPVAPDLASEYADELSVSQKTEVIAKYFAEEHGGLEGETLPHTPQTIAASSLYVAGLISNEGIVQREIADTTGVSEPSIRDCWHTIANHAGADVDNAKNTSRLDLDPKIREALESAAPSME
jgi:transcription initiation factor TFIIIB Brf1 subunit/transcription initiation factor TFIIB